MVFTRKKKTKVLHKFISNVSFPIVTPLSCTISTYIKKSPPKNLLSTDSSDAHTQMFPNCCQKQTFFQITWFAKALQITPRTHLKEDPLH